MRGLVKVPYIDKHTGVYYEPGKEVEYADARIEELAALGFVELKSAPKTEPEAKKAVEKKVERKVETPKPEPKTAKKPTNKKKESR